MSESGSPVVLAPSSELFAILREAFERDPDAVVALTTSGLSMYPMLRDRKDVVYLAKLKTLPKKYDVVLFRRDSGAYVLHRVVRVEPDGATIFCGDNQTVLERVPYPNQLIAIVRLFQRGSLKIDCEKSIIYRFYSRLWPKTRFFRRMAVVGAGKIKKTIKGTSREKSLQTRNNTSDSRPPSQGDQLSQRL